VLLLYACSRDCLLCRPYCKKSSHNFSHESPQFLKLLQSVPRKARSCDGAIIMSTTSFRKIDIDAFDEDVLQESELYDPDSRDPSEALSDAKQKAAAVRTSLSR
jgi:hypothetical protein